MTCRFQTGTWKTKVCRPHSSGKLHDALEREAFVAFGAVRGEVDGRARLDERANAVERVAGGGLVLEDDAELVRLSRHRQSRPRRRTAPRRRGRASIRFPSTA